MINQPLAGKRRAYQDSAFWALWARRKIRRYLLLWLRQGGKTTTLADQSLREMMLNPGRLITFVSASLTIGSEMIVKESERLELIEKEAKLWKERLILMRAQAEADGKQLVTGQSDAGEDSFKELPAEIEIPDLCEILERSKFELRLKHSNATYSRTKVIAANIATARSWSGSVKFDEIAFVRHLDVLLAELEPFFSTDPSLNMVMSTTLPDDYGHYSYELAGPPDDNEFPVSEKGHWYRSRGGILVHRVSIDDAYEAGRKCFHPETGDEQTPNENRETSLNREGWDRSNRHKRPTVGTSAVSPMVLDAAMDRGRKKGAAQENELPAGWTESLGDGALTLGLDQASAEGKKANPASLAAIEKVAGRYVTRGITWWKTSSPAVATAKIVSAVDAILAAGKKIKVLCIDASNEVMFARMVKTALRGKCKVKLIKGGQKASYRGEDVNMKVFTGNMLANAFEDHQIDMPGSKYVGDDFARVKRSGSSFETAVGPNGEHGDTFDAVKLALYGQLSNSGPAHAKGVRLGTFGRKGPRPGLRALLQWAGKKIRR